MACQDLREFMSRLSQAGELKEVVLDTDPHLQAGAINVYNQENIFYYDVYTHRQVLQLPLVPYVSMKLETR